ncbi:MAG TPA: hypothetical protein VLI90_05390 [Tepidisphaeraceae bacterium]|nr:hypothetical protein [Tepidisphaeraceae bacterium]
MNSDGGVFLTQEGLQRREQIAAMARAAARARRRRRVQVRMISVSAAVAVCAFTAVTLNDRPRRVTMPGYLPHVAVRNSSPRAPGVIVARIETDPNITTRLAIPRQPPRWRVVGDDDLLQTLTEAGHPAGLVRMNGQAMLLVR